MPSMHETKPTSRACRGGWAVALAALLVQGCAEKKVEVAPWSPPPPVTWSDLSARSIPPLANGHRILVPQPTQGLFPGAVAVTRVAVVDEGGAGSPRKLRLLRDPRNEFLQWNSAFDDQLAVSEVFPIAQRNLGGADPEPTPIVAAERALNARIGLVYAMNELTPTETEMFGVFYDTATVRALAAVHARAEAPPLPPDADEDDPVDLWTYDSKALVRARFERVVYDCLRELIVHDEAAPIEAPTGWTPVLPARSATWPPYVMPPDG